jgi:hypothetical protein
MGLNLRALFVPEVDSISRAHPLKAPKGVAHLGPRGAHSPRNVPVLATEGVRC